MATEIERLFQEAGALLEGHFLLTSGLHSSGYLEKFKVLERPQLTQTLCGIIAEHFRDSGIEAVAGPTVGGVLLAFEVARQLGVRALYAERETLPNQKEGRAFRRSTLRPGERVLVVDDVLTTGGSLRDVLDAVRRALGEVVAAAVLVDRSAGGIDLGVPLFCCHRLSIPTYPPEGCPLCAQGLPLVKPGSRPL